MDDHKSKDRSALMDVEYEDIAISYLFLMIKKAIRDSGYSEKWDPKVDGERLVDERYGEYPQQKMDVYVPKTIDPSKSRGAFLFMHGGAYVGGDRREQEGVAKAMAKEGYLTANIEYTLYNKTLKERRSSYSVDMLLEDVRLALTKLVEIGRQHGYNVEKVALSGHSAGGHVSMLYGFRSRTLEGFESPVEVAFVAPRVCCVDFHADMWKSGKNPKIMTWFTSFLSGVPIGKRLYLNPDEKTEEAIKSISPQYDVKPGVPPVVAAYGAKDQFVPLTHPELLKKKFAELGAKSVAEFGAEDVDAPAFDLLVFPNSDHTLAQDRDCAQKWLELLKTYAERYLTVPSDFETNAE